MDIIYYSSWKFNIIVMTTLFLIGNIGIGGEDIGIILELLFLFFLDLSQ